MTLDQSTNPYAVPRNGPVWVLLQQLLNELGDGWRWDDSVQIGTYLKYGDKLTIHIEDAGHGAVAVNAMMPDKFMPQIGFVRQFSIGAKEIARKILHEIVPDYIDVTEITLGYQNEQQQWEKDTDSLFEAIGGALDLPTKVAINSGAERGRSVLFQYGVGDSLRIYAQPGSAPSMQIYVREPDDLWPFVDAFAHLDRPQPEPAQAE